MFFLLLLMAHAEADPAVLPSKSGEVNIVPHSRYLIDTNATLNEQTVLHQLDTFRPYKNAIYNFGFVDKPIWILFEVDFSRAFPDEWILRIDYPHIDRFILYRIDGEQLVPLGENGDRVVCGSGPECRTYWQPLLHRGTHARYLLYLQTEGALQVPMVAQPLREAYHDESKANLLFGIYYGMLLLLLLYNLVLYIVVREVHYLNYLLFLGSYMLFQLNFDGVGKEWLWPDNTWMGNDGLAFFIFLAAMFAFRLSRQFLALRHYAPTMEKLLYACEFLSLAGVVVSLLLPYHIAITMAAGWSAIIPWVLIYAGFRVLPRYRAARYYLAGWIVFLFGTIVVALNELGLLPTHPVMFYAQQIGSLLQMILLSFALADRISMIKIDSVARLREFNEQLQERIAKKVEELRQKDQMMIQQSRQAAMGEMIENIAHQWRQPLNQLSLIQSNIFFQYQLGALSEEQMEEYRQQSEDLMAYMTHTIDDFRNFFLPERETAPFCICTGVKRAIELLGPTLKRHHIETRLDCDGNPYALGHENEFSQVVINILNNAKDALLEHHTEAPLISVRITEEGDEVRIEICDNGGGIDTKIIDKIFDPYFTTKFQSQGTGIGLYMVKMIMEKSMNGRVRALNRGEGACFVLELPKYVSKEESDES